MKTSEAGRAQIARREGCRLHAYRDVAGVWTIGIGHTGRMAGPPVTAGMTIDATQADAFLRADLAPVEAAIRDSVKLPVSQSEYDALASFGFNIGAVALKRSTVVRRLNVGDIEGAADAFLMWNKPAALASRRAEERAQFLSQGSDAPAITSARAAVLAARVDRTHQDARTARSGAAALAVGGGAAMVIAHHHHHTLPLVCGALALVAGCLAALGALARHAQAHALAVAAQKGSDAHSVSNQTK